MLSTLIPNQNWENKSRFCTAMFMLHFCFFPFNFGRVANTGKNAIKRNAIFHITKSLDFGQRPSIYLIHWFALSSYLSTHIVVVLTWFSPLMQYSPDLIRLLVKWGIGSWTTRFSEYKTFSQSRQSSKCDIKTVKLVSTYVVLHTRHPVTYKIPRPIWIDCPFFLRKKKKETNSRDFSE